MGKFARTWALLVESWTILKKDRVILILPLFSMVSCLLVSASFILPWLPDLKYQPLTNIESLSFWQPWIQKLQALGLALGSGDHSVSISLKNNLDYYLMIFFLFYLCNYFVIVFFNSAMVACVAIRREGGTPTLGDALRAAFGRLPAIAGWVLLSATVGLVLRHIEERSSFIGNLVAGFLGLAWTLASFLVVPIMVVEKDEPIAALKKSALLLKKTWGENLISNFSFGVIFALLSIPAYLICIWGIRVAGLGFFPTFGLAAVYLIILAMFQSALQTIFLAALYYYARSGEVPAGFSKELLANSLASK
jgi:hypothetical protein